MANFPSPAGNPEAPQAHADSPSPMDPVKRRPVAVAESDLDEPESLVFDDLARELSKPVEVEEEFWQLGQREGWHVRYRRVADFSEMERAQKGADRARKKPNARPGETDVDVLKASAILLAAHNTGIVRKGREWLDGNGDPVTFRHPELLRQLGVSNARDAVTTAYGWDADVVKHANRLQEASGWTPYGDEEDPTQDA